MKEKSLQALEDCVEKAAKLRSMKLDKHVAQTVRGFRGRKLSDDEWEFEFDLPDEEKGDASLFTFRLFLQHNEDYSFEQIPHLISDTDLSDEFRVKMTDAYRDYVDLSNQHPVDIKPDFFEVGEYHTWGELLRVVLYGFMAHTNDKTKRAKYKRWTRDGLRKYVLLQHFWFIVAELLNHVYRIASLCSEELDRQGKKTLPEVKAG
jgi:hypothetical protein